MPSPPRARSPRIAEVVRVERLGARMVRVVFGGPGLAGFGAGEFTDHYVKLQIPPLGAPYGAPFDMQDIRDRFPSAVWPRTRTYTVQNWDDERGELSVDFVLHGATGVAGPWAEGARPGDRLQLGGPGGAYTPDPTADWHLMVGDTSVLPAISASLPRIPAGVVVHVLVAVHGPDDRRELSTPGLLRLSWIDQSTGDGGDALCEALRGLTFPPGRVHCFVHGEAGSVRAMRRHLLVERGLPREALSISGYWKLSRDEDGWREDKREWNRLVELDAAPA